MQILSSFREAGGGREGAAGLSGSLGLWLHFS